MDLIGADQPTIFFFVELLTFDTLEFLVGNSDERDSLELMVDKDGLGKC